MNDIDTKSLKEILSNSNHKLFSLYYTLGYPEIASADIIFKAIAESGKVDFIELGMPYSDPLADGLTIQQTSSKAIQNGITIEIYFDMAKQLKQHFGIPLIFMGYFNPVFQYGIKKFCQRCNDAGIEGVIIPDLPVEIYESQYKEVFAAYNILVSFLITPTTSDERIRQIEKLTTGFIYVVSSNSITGKNGTFSNEQVEYFERIQRLVHDKPTIVGFSIHDRETYEEACRYADGAIIGSAFLRILEVENINESVTNFIQSIKP